LKDKCTVCNSFIEELFKKKLLGKYTVIYYKCVHCGFLETDKPFWLEEAYNSPITNLDLGLLSRNIHYSKTVEEILSRMSIDINAKFIDYGGGYGVFVRLMRDKGFDFYRQDLYCENLFANHFDITNLHSDSKFEILTAFELFEHLEDPYLELNKMFSFSDTIIFSTLLQPLTDLENWWYLAPETGQHISFYTKKALETISDKNRCFLYSNNNDLHIFSKTKILQDPFSDINLQSNSIFDKIFRTSKVSNKTRNSLLQKDFNYILSKVRDDYENNI
jgi:hypothetical protein